MSPRCGQFSKGGYRTRITTFSLKNNVFNMDVLLNGLSISAKEELTVAVLHDRKNDATSMSPFGC